MSLAGRQVVSANPTDRVERQTFAVALAAQPGPVTLAFTAHDGAGHPSAVVSAGVTLIADAPPQLVSAAVEGSSSIRVGSSFTVRVEATDDVGVAAITETLPSGITASGVVVENPGPTDRIEHRTYFLAASFPPGPAAILYAARDSAGQTSSSSAASLTATADAAPSVSISSPAAGTHVFAGTPVTVTFTASDDLGVASVVLTLGTTTLTVPNPPNGTPVTRTIAAPATAGALSLTAVATDTTGHADSATPVPVTVDVNQPPTLQVLSPAANATVLSGSMLAVLVSSSDDVGVTSVDAAFQAQLPISKTNPPATATLNVPVPSVSSATALTLTVHASDGFNPVVTKTVSLNVVPDAPPVVALTAPADGIHVISGATLLVTGTLTDDNNNATATVTFGSLPSRTASVGGFSFSFVAPVVASTTSTPLDATAVDGSGHPAAPVHLNVIVDPDLQAPAVSIGSPASGSSIVGGLPVLLSASATDNVAVASLRYRANGGSWNPVSGSSFTTSVPTPNVSVDTSYAFEVQATDGAGNATSTFTVVTLKANQPPVVTVTAPLAGQKLTSGLAFQISGTAADDSGTPTISASFNGTPILPSVSASGTYQIAWTPIATSTPVSGTLLVSAVDPQGNASAPVAIPVTIVPDVGGTPTVSLAVPGVLVVGDTTALSVTFADNVGLATGEAEVTGGFSSGGHQTYSLSGTTQTIAVPVASAEAPFGVPATITAKTTDLSARSANLSPNPTVIPVAYHRLVAPLPAGPYAEGSLITASFHLSPTGRARATMLRFEIGTGSGASFSAVTCIRKLAPLGDTETLTVPVPVGRPGLVIRSVLVEATGAIALAARADASGLFQDSITTVADAANPTVTMASPSNGDSVVTGTQFNVTANGTDDVRVASIDVTLDGITKRCAGATCTVPFFAPAVTAPKAYTITAVAHDSAGKTGTATVSINVTLPAGPVPPTPPEPLAGDGKRPHVRFLTPLLSPEAVPENAEFVPTAEASDADGIAKLEFFLDDDTVPCATQDPLADPAAPRAGCFVPRGEEGTLHRLRVRATDGSGATAEAEASLVVRDGVRITAPTSIEAGEGAYEGRRLYVESDVQVAGPLAVTELYVRHGARLAAPHDGAAAGMLAVNASGDIVSDVGSLVTASGAAPAGLLAPDETEVTSASGAPHGGDAGPAANLRLAYGSFANPRLPGASGAPAGTHGGGVITLHADRIVLGGILSADGEPAAVGQEGRGGLGAGGSILLDAADGIYGLPDDSGAFRFGHVSARGGAADAVPDLPAPLLGAGGRVALRGAEVAPVTVDVSGSTRRDGAAAGAGTIFVRDDAHPNGLLAVVARGRVPSTLTTTTHLPRVGSGVLRLDELQVTGGARLVVADRFEIPFENILVDVWSTLETP